MSIAAEMDAPLTVLALAHAKLAHRPGNADICAQLVAALQHLEELRLAVQALEQSQAARPRAAMVLPHEAPQRHPSLAELDGAVIVSLHEARMVRRGLVQP
jgi:hypothetical protein